jgi:NADH-quinone oxidoreductase subunit N
MFLSAENIATLQQNLREDCWAFMPELILCGTIVLMLLMRLVPAFDRWHLGTEALVLTVVALLVSLRQWQLDFTATNAFSGLLRFDNFTIFIRIFLYSFTALVIWLSMLTGIPDTEDSADFYSLLLGAVIGMSLMASANHLLMVFIAIEMASLPSFALAGFLKGKRASSEAALKYVVYGGGASGIMLYGISLIAGRFGTGYLPDLGKVMFEATATGVDAVMLLGLLFIFVGLAFKLSAVPFHFWCPDVFEGAAAEVAAFLSVASKGAALALLARLMLSVVGHSTEAFQNLGSYLIPVIAIFAAITATFGNLAAYPQTNLKRLLAYSTIAHAGYMLMGLATLTPEGVSAVLFYLVAYLLMNLGAFAIVAFLRNVTGSEELSSFRGLIYRSPVMVITLAVFLLSLLGLPPLAGFAAKFQIFRVLYDAGQSQAATGHTTLAYVLYGLLAVGGINTVISVVYYLKVLKVMILEQPLEEIEGQPAKELPVPAGSAFFATVLAALVLVLGILWNPLVEMSTRGVRDLPDRGRPVPLAVVAPREVPVR